MNFLDLPLIVALLVQIVLGVAVYSANNRRASNQCFLALSLIVGSWLLCIKLGVSASNEEVAVFWVRQASMFGSLVITGFNFLRLSIVYRQEGWPTIWRRGRAWLGCNVAVAVLAQTTVFLRGVSLRATGGSQTIVRPFYGPGAAIYWAFMLIGFAILIGRYIRDTRRTTGSEREELRFVLVACFTSIFLGTVFSLVLPLFFSDSQSIKFAPLRVIVLSLIIAYGIATRRIMNAGAFVRNAVAYLLLGGYVSLLYAGVWWGCSRALAALLIDGSHLPHLLAAAAVALSSSPAHGLSQLISTRLLINSRGLDFRATVNKAAAILQAVRTLPELLDRFARTITEAVGADHVSILLLKRNSYREVYPPARPGEEQRSLELIAADSIVRYLISREQPVVLDELHRIRLTPEVERVLSRMQQLRIAVAMGIFSRHELVGVMLLGPRLSGRIYGSIEQNALEVLCGQLAVAIENAELFTQIQNAKIYNDVLLENLTTGVVAANADGTITVFNHEAEQITQHGSKDMLGRNVEELPSGLGEVIRETLRLDERKRERELVLRSTGAEGRTLVTRAGSSIFRGEDGVLLGALMVLTDITALKKLEMQIRRNDRLASLGTLSAGMAHEIKNPLVSIKTFAQLLPERYQDADFRETFSTLIGHEVDRIDTLVNQLLRFARPAKPQLVPTHVHEIIEKTLRLVSVRLDQKQIKLTRSFRADVDTARADADQLEQVFLNFFINAMDAMKQHGELQVTTCTAPAEEWTPSTWSGGIEERFEHIRITVQDNGEGIRPENVSHVFDPFFTTKDYGTGLGLSVVHGIIQEHGGQIEVESQLAKGTSFHILLPIYRSDDKRIQVQDAEAA